MCIGRNADMVTEYLEKHYIDYVKGLQGQDIVTEERMLVSVCICVGVYVCVMGADASAKLNQTRLN